MVLTLISIGLLESTTAATNETLGIGIEVHVIRIFLEFFGFLIAGLTLIFGVLSCERGTSMACYADEITSATSTCSSVV